MRLREKVKKLFENEKFTYLDLRILLSNADKELEGKNKELNELRNYQLHAQDDLLAKDKIIAKLKATFEEIKRFKFNDKIAYFRYSQGEIVELFQEQFDDLLTKDNKHEH